MICPKCGTESGNDWSQCEGSCPIMVSPHYKPQCANGLFATLTPAQQKAALEYRGEESFGDPEFKRK